MNGKCSPVAAPAAAATTASSSAAGGIKWHPGHYVWIDPHTDLNTQLSQIDQLSAETSVQGIQLIVNWSSLEGSTPGDYSAGFALIDTYLAKLASLQVPKRLILGVNERSFGNPPSAGTPCAQAASGLLPAYLAQQGDGGCAIAPPGSAGMLAVFARFWEPAVMDRLIALSQAYAQRYDGNPLLEMFYGNGETAVAAPASTGFTQDAYNAQLKRWFDASTKVWQHTQLRLLANYDGSNSQTLDLMNYVTSDGGAVIIGGPDPELPLPSITRTVQANELFRGAAGSSQDFRSTYPWVGEVQGLGIGIKYTQTPSDLWNYESGTMHGSYMIWYRNTYMGGAAQQWSTGMLPFIQSIQGAMAATGCPPSYSQGCNTQ